MALPFSDANVILARLIEQFGTDIYRLARSIVSDEALANDVVQETLLRAWGSMDRWPEGDVPRAWLLKVARNQAISMLRKRRDEPMEPESLTNVATSDRSTADVVNDRVAVERFWAALESLDPQTRSIVVMREISDLSYEEISEVLNLPLPTVKTRLFRARRKLQTILEEWK